ncbi:MAG TPA: hypothetical protein VF502_14025 [Stellaceae bacterium]
MRRNSRIFAAALTSVAAGALLATTLASPAAADSSSTVRWKTIIGIIQAANVVGGIGGGGQPWSTLGGDARVDLSSGRIDFEVRGLVLAGGNTIGTRAGIAKVKGTLVCDPGAADQAIVDTPAVDLSLTGDAEFDGNVGPIRPSARPTTRPSWCASPPPRRATVGSPTARCAAHMATEDIA